MKLLLDENLPKRLKFDYASHEVFTVSDLGWTGVKNGAILELMIRHNFDCLITFDKNLQHQQNFKKNSICVIVLSAANNTYVELSRLSKQVLIFLNKDSLPVGPFVVDTIANQPAPKTRLIKDHSLAGRYVLHKDTPKL